MYFLAGNLQAGHGWKQYECTQLLKYSKYIMLYLLEAKSDKIMCILGTDNETWHCIGTGCVSNREIINFKYLYSKMKCSY